MIKVTRLNDSVMVNKRRKNSIFAIDAGYGHHLYQS
jgi:hypothetical protein